jgi:hypothetical protein
MRKLKLIRTAKRPSYTIGKLYIDGEYFCDTLEDKYRNLDKQTKIAGETAIPYGTYEVIVNRSPKFGRDLPRLLNVPKFEGILIHRGNSVKDTAGCILVGENKIVGGLINSTKYEIGLTEILKKCGSTTIEVV